MTTPVLWASTPRVDDAAESLRALEAARRRTRSMRGSHWLVAVVFGLVVLGAVPFYVTGRCRQGICSTYGARSVPFGQAFNANGATTTLTTSATTYWMVGVAMALAIVVAYHRHRARLVGLQGRLWPAIAACAGTLALLGWTNSGGTAQPRDFWFRGTAALLVVALAVAVDALLERSLPFGLFAAGFIGLALLCCLYTVVDVFQRAGLGGMFSGDGQALPNLVLPGAYLLLGGIGFLLGRGWNLQPALSEG